MSRMRANKHNDPKCNDNCNGKKVVGNSYYFCKCRCHTARKR